MLFRSPEKEIKLPNKEALQKGLLNLERHVNNLQQFGQTVVVALNRFHAGAFALTSVMFGIAHGDHWIQGVLCGAAYQWLVLRKSRLGDAMLAHAITNLIISIYAVVTNQWQFT